MEHIDFTNYLTRLPDLLKETNKTVYVTSTSDCILCGVDEYNNPTNLPTYNTHNFGGIIINFKEDICVGHYEWHGFTWGDQFIDRLQAYLISRGLNATRDGNDCLVDGYKVGSYMSQTVNGMIYTATHVSIGMDLDLIKAICTKPMVKTPKGLEDYGITQEEIIAWVESNYENK